MKNKLFLISLLIILLNKFDVLAQNLNFTATTVCFEEQTTFTGPNTYNDSTITSWLWDLDNDSIYTGIYDRTGKIVKFDFSSIYSQGDTFFVSLKIVTNTGTTDSITKEVIVYPKPVANFKTDTWLCRNQEASFIDISIVEGESIKNRYWDIGNNDTIDSDDSVYTFTIAGLALNYTIKLIVISDNNCTDTELKTMSVWDQPDADFSIQNTCFKDSTLFNNNTILNDSLVKYFLWNFGDGEESSDKNSKHKYNTVGTYSVSLIAVTNRNCIDTSEFVDIEIKPLPDLSLSFSGDTVLYPKSDVTITANGNFTSALWSTGETADSITVSHGGKYSVEVTGANGCKNSESATVQIKNVNRIIVNNILTPNSDGINDYLTIEDMNAFEKCELYIYNMWGEEIYFNLDYKNDWKGENDGKPLDAGTYYYIIKAVNKANNSEINTKGNINILR